MKSSLFDISLIFTFRIAGVFRAGLDGQGRMTLADTDMVWPKGLTIGENDSFGQLKSYKMDSFCMLHY